MKKTKKLICALLVAVFAAGVFLTAYSASMLIREKVIVNTYEHTQAVISHMKENENGKEDFVITYNALGERYEKTIKTSDSEVKLGRTFDLYYNSDNPDDFYLKVGSRYRYTLAEGLLLTVLSLAILALIIVPAIVKKKLIKQNKWAMCKVIKVKRNSKTTCRIYCDSSKFPKRKGKPFVSAPYKGKLPKSIKEGSLMVYYSEKNPNFYYVETDKLS